MSKKSKTQTATIPTPGVIAAGESYTLDEFLQRVGWGERAWRSARRNGLLVRSAGGRRYITGSDFHEYLRKSAAPTETPPHEEA